MPKTAVVRSRSPPPASPFACQCRVGSSDQGSAACIYSTYNSFISVDIPPTWSGTPFYTLPAPASSIAPSHAEQSSSERRETEGEREGQTMTGSRRTRRPCSMVIVACAAMAGNTCYGFQTSAPSFRNERKAPRASQLQQLREVGPRRVQQRQGSRPLHGVVGYARFAGKGWVLRSERADGGDQEQFSEVRLSAFGTAFETCDVGSTC